MDNSHRQAVALVSGAAALAAIVVLLIVILSGGSSSSQRRGPEPIFEAEPQLLADPSATIATLRSLGVSRIRLVMPWSAIAPNAGSSTRPPHFTASDPAAYPARGWRPYDAIVRDATARGIGLDLTLAGPAPQWATGPHPAPRAPAGVWKPSAKAFGAFVSAVATRYSGHYASLPRVSFWSIWNEPNYGPNLAPQAIDHSTVEVSPVLYRGLIDAAWSALNDTGHGRDTILIGELAPRGLTVGDVPGNFSGMVPLRFLRALYCVDGSYRPLQGDAATVRGCPGTGPPSAFLAAHPALFKATGFAVHPYPQGRPPNVATPGEPDYADLPVAHRLETTLDRLQVAYGSHTRFPIYSTEYGYQTNPPEQAARVSPSLAAYYINWAEYLTWRDPRIRSYMQYLLVDPPRGNFATGLVFANGRPKPTYDAYRLPIYLPVTSARPGQSLEIWGCVRPGAYAARDTGKRQRVEIQFALYPGRRFRTIQTVAISSRFGYFDVHYAFSGSGSVRLRWTYPDGRTVYSRGQGVFVG